MNSKSTPEPAWRPCWGAALRDPLLFLVTAGLSGLLRPAPGTWGSLLAAAIAWPLAVLLPAPWNRCALVTLTLLALLGGQVALMLLLRRRPLHDPGWVVIDEVAGVFIACSLFPSALLTTMGLPIVVICLILFRVFDILKPWPISQAERLPGAWGIMADDVLAGVLAGLCVFAFFI